MFVYRNSSKLFLKRGNTIKLLIVKSYIGAGGGAGGIPHASTVAPIKATANKLIRTVEKVDIFMQRIFGM